MQNNMLAKNRIVLKMFVLIIITINLAIINNTIAQTIEKKYPNPNKSDIILFYIQRSMNLNTIVYELNIDKYGKLNSDNPVHPYWIRYEENEEIEELSFIQKKLAYGIDAELVNKKNQIYNLTLVSYPTQLILLKKLDENSKTKAYTTVNGKFIELQKIFFKTESENFMSNHVLYIDVSGIEVTTSNYITERIKP